MNLLFGLFRFLTWGNLISLGLLALLILLGAMASMVGASNATLPILMLLMLLAPSAFHNVMCLRLQKNMLNKGKPLPSGFPVQMILISLLVFIYGILVINSVVRTLYFPISAEAIDMAAKMQPKASKTELAETYAKSQLLGSVLAGIHAVAIIINCVLSSFFLNKWKKDREQAENNEHFFDV